MFSGLWNSLTKRAKDMKSRSSCRAALACTLALANREEAIRKGEERTFDDWTSHSGGIATLHLGYRRKLEHLIEYCVTKCAGRHLPLLWRILMHSAHLAGDSQRCKELFYRAFRDCPMSKVDFSPNSKQICYLSSIFFYFRIYVWMLLNIFHLR